MDDLLSEFLTETNENLAVLDVELVRLERNPGDPELLGNIFRLVHTIKGTCGFLGLPRLERVAHAAENVLGLFRDGELPVTEDAVSAILDSLDAIKIILAALERTGGEPPGDDAGLIARLDAFAAACEAPGQGKDLVLSGLGAEGLPAEIAVGGWSGEESREPAVAAQTIRVNVDLLENLMTMVSELVLTRNQLLQIQRAQRDSDFATPLQRLNHITSELQEGVMKTRMQPIASAWAKLPRLVRDLGHELGKKIDLQMLGADTELDRQVLELVRDPLTHMVRNAADHGLEAPAERLRAGKPETGRITLNAYHEGGRIIIEIADDGRGLDLERIRRKAVQNGLATEAELAAASMQQIAQYIMKPGFSTARQVTSVSGRGVGMDVVRNNIEKIGGAIDIRSEPGRGSTFIVKIPLTLAIISALIVGCAGERFAIPQVGVVELVRAAAKGAHRIEHLNGTPVLRLRERLLPLVSLERLLKLGDGAGKDEVYVVVIQVGALSFGIVVDQVFDTEEIVVKPVAPILRHIGLYSGNTILGDGPVIMILDPNGIAKAVGDTAAGHGEAAAPAATVPAARTDDTLALLLFRAGGGTPKAVPLSLVARLEEIDPATVEISNAQPVVQYRGRLMPLAPVDPGWRPGGTGRQPMLVLADGDRSMGLIVDEIIDIVEERITIQLPHDRAGLIGSAIVAGRATEIIDAGYYRMRACRDWFAASAALIEGRAAGAAGRVLLVDGDPLFRDLVSPLLVAAGYEVATADSALRALDRLERGEHFDAILSDVAMPGMSASDFAAAVRADPRWRDVPLIALSGQAGLGDADRGRQAGFTDHVARFDREALLATLSRRLFEVRGVAA